MIDRFNKQLQFKLKHKLDNNILLDGGILKQIVSKQNKERNRILGLIARYNQEYLPIKKRKCNDILTKHNYILEHDFCGLIVRNSLGYVLGNPIKYNIIKYDENENVYDYLDEEIWSLNKNNNIQSIDFESSLYAMLCGYSGKLLYVKKDGSVGIEVVRPDELFFIGNLHDPDYVIRYYKTFTEDGENEIWQFVVYNSHTYTIYNLNKDNSVSVVENNIHFFDCVPIVFIKNNIELRGEVERVLTLIDAYDSISSDFANDLSEMRSAYMAVLGNLDLTAVDEESGRLLIDIMLETGILNIPYDENGNLGDIKFVTKDIDVEGYKTRLETLADDILKFSDSINFNDDTFGESSGIAMRFKLLALELKASNYENYYKTSLSQLYKIYFSYLSKKNKNFSYDYNDIEFVFTRNLPVNFEDEVSIFNGLYGKVSDETAYSVLSIVKDVQHEIDLKNKNN